jgi:flagellar assembly protein FliH
MSSSRIVKSLSDSEKGEHFFLQEFEGGEPPTEIPLDDSFRPLFAEFTVDRVVESVASGSVNDAFEHMFAEYMPLPVVVEEPLEPAIDIEALLAGMISEEEAQQRIDEAYDSGFAESRRQFEEDLTVVSRAFGAAVAEIGELHELLLKESEDDLLGLAIKLAERIIRKEITTDRAILARTVAEIVGKMTDHDGVTIRFNPEDYKVIMGSGALAHAGLADTVRMDVKADENVALGGCTVETTSGQVNGQIEAQMTELFNQLTEERVSRPVESEEEEEAEEVFRS